MSLGSDSTNLDFLRATAVLLVLVSHVLFATYGQPCDWIAKPMGRIGVLFFFVHTCTVLMLSLERRPDTVRFYVRRFFRIYPLSVFAVLVYAAFQIPNTGWLLNEYPKISGKDILANLLLVQNLTLSKDVLSVLWSLPLEIQMYVVLPLLYRFRKISIELLWIGSAALAAIWPFMGGFRIRVLRACRLIASPLPSSPECSLIDTQNSRNESFQHICGCHLCSPLLLHFAGSQASTPAGRRAFLWAMRSRDFKSCKRTESPTALQNIPTASTSDTCSAFISASSTYTRSRLRYDARFRF